MLRSGRTLQDSDRESEHRDKARDLEDLRHGLNRSSSLNKIDLDRASDNSSPHQRGLSRDDDASKNNKTLQKSHGEIELHSKALVTSKLNAHINMDEEDQELAL